MHRHLGEDLGSTSARGTTTDNGNTHFAVSLELVAHLEVGGAARAHSPVIQHPRMLKLYIVLRYITALA